MDVVISALLWVHFVALALGLGCGIAMSQVGPRLVGAPADQRDLWWPLANMLTRMAVVGMALLLISGPALLWLKFGGASALGLWFAVKMALVAVALVALGVTEWAKAKFRRGEEAAGQVMNRAGRVIGVSVLGVIAAAVLTFH
jgi:hypothetical protein